MKQCNFNIADMNIIHKLVGEMTDQTATVLGENVECFLHPEVGLFIPARGQCAYAVSPNHVHPAYTFVYYFQPVTDFIVEEAHLTYDLTGGKCFSAMSPQIPHQEVEEEYFQSFIVIAISQKYFEKTVLQYIPSIPVFRGEIFVPHPELLEMLRCFMLEAGKSNQVSFLDQLAAIITHLVVRSVILEKQNDVPLYDRFEVDRAISYMNSHIAEKITLEELAMQVNLSAGYFSKIFKTETGETPIDYLNMLRLHKARLMLLNDKMNITDIGLACGFNSSSYFSTCFLEKYHMTPSAYRQKLLTYNKCQY